MQTATETPHYARRPHNYGGLELDRDQVLKTLGGYRNDDDLVRLGYLAPVVPDTVLKECGVCGAEFISEGGRNQHHRDKHGERHRPLTADEEDAIDAEREAQTDRIAPLYLDKTKASRGETVEQIKNAAKAKGK